jgi:hypothetical protein
MNMPGLTAEASLYKSTGSYLMALQTAGGKGKATFPAFFPPDILQPCFPAPPAPFAALSPAALSPPSFVCLYLGALCLAGDRGACRAWFRECAGIACPVSCDQSRCETCRNGRCVPLCDPAECLTCHRGREGQNGACVPICPEGIECCGRGRPEGPGCCPKGWRCADDSRGLCELLV